MHTYIPDKLIQILGCFMWSLGRWRAAGCREGSTTSAIGSFGSRQGLLYIACPIYIYIHSHYFQTGFQVPPYQPVAGPRPPVAGPRPAVAIPKAVPPVPVAADRMVSNILFIIEQLVCMYIYVYSGLAREPMYTSLQTQNKNTVVSRWFASLRRGLLPKLAHHRPLQQ